MGVSIECYRQRIGCFNNSNISIKGYSNFKKKSTKKNRTKMPWSPLLRMILMFTVCFHLLAVTSKAGSSSANWIKTSLGGQPSSLGISW